MGYGSAVLNCFREIKGGIPPVGFANVADDPGKRIAGGLAESQVIISLNQRFQFVERFLEILMDLPMFFKARVCDPFHEFFFVGKVLNNIVGQGLAEILAGLIPFPFADQGINLVEHIHKPNVFTINLFNPEFELFIKIENLFSHRNRILSKVFPEWLVYHAANLKKGLASIILTPVPAIPGWCILAACKGDCNT